jgi:ankyrin repeat protein
MLLERGIDPNPGFLLHDAALKGFGEMAKLLVAHGAKIDAVNKNGSTPLHDAALAGHAHMIEILAASGADVNAREAESGATPIHHAASWGRTAAVRALLAARADPSIPNKAGQTPLAAAIANEHPETAAVLKALRRD